MTNKEQLKGKLQEMKGKITGDDSEELKGKLTGAAGDAKEKAGDAMDKAAGKINHKLDKKDEDRL